MAAANGYPGGKHVSLEYVIRVDISVELSLNILLPW